jgi:RNA polymerase sigma-70 factor, ECF subfamily
MTALPNIETLYENHRKRALAIVRRIVKDADEAEDVVQEVFARLSLREVKFDGRASYTTWLHRVLINSSINALRGKKRRDRLCDCDATYVEESDTPTPLENAVENERHEKFIEALKELSPQHQLVVSLRDLRGLSYPEISRLLKIPEGTVKSALNRGRSNLMSAMQSHVEPNYF